MTPQSVTYELYRTHRGFAVLRVCDEQVQVIDFFSDETAAEDFVATMNFVLTPRRPTSH